MWLRGAKLIVLGLLGFCASLGSAAWAQQVEKPPTANSPKIHYAVEDLILGDNVDPDSLTSRTYHCSPSEQFVGFTWCTNRASKGRAYTVYSILHSPDDKIVYANKTLEPAFSSPAEAERGTSTNCTKAWRTTTNYRDAFSTRVVGRFDCRVGGCCSYAC